MFTSQENTRRRAMLDDLRDSREVKQFITFHSKLWKKN